MLIFRQREFSAGYMPERISELYSKFKSVYGKKAKKELINQMGPEHYAREVGYYRELFPSSSSEKVVRGYEPSPEIRDKYVKKILNGRKVEELSQLEREKFNRYARKYRR